MEWLDFQKSGLPTNAAWHLNWPSQDWNAPLLGALTLQLNSADALIRRLPELPEGDYRRELLVRTALLDVVKQLVISALLSDDFVDHEEQFSERTVGYVVRLLLRSSFPNDSLMTLRARLRDHPGVFHTELQHEMNIFDIELPND